MSNNHLLPPTKRPSKKHNKNKLGFVQVSESDTDESSVLNVTRNNTPSPCPS